MLMNSLLHRENHTEVESQEDPFSVLNLNSLLLRGTCLLVIPVHSVGFVDIFYNVILVLMP